MDKGTMLLLVLAVVWAGIIYVCVREYIFDAWRWKRLWCTLRGHPYPHVCDPELLDEYRRGEWPFRPAVQCSHCGKGLR